MPPYDSFYNGNASLMIANGTFADHISVFQDRVKWGKLSPEKYNQYVEQWNAIPLEEKQRRRNIVIADSTPVPQEIITPQGKVFVYRAKPSDNNSAEPVQKTRGRPKGKKVLKVPIGTLTAENNPLSAEPIASVDPASVSVTPS